MGDNELVTPRRFHVKESAGEGETVRGNERKEGAFFSVKVMASEPSIRLVQNLEAFARRVVGSRPQQQQ
jgi:hypothetical protein